MEKIVETLVAAHDPLLTGLAAVPGTPSGVLEQAARHLLATRFSALVPRVAVVEFHAFRERAGLPADPGSTVATDAWLDSFGPAEVRRWSAEYPVLGRLLDRVARNTAAHVDRVARQLAEDRAELVGTGLLDRDAGELVRLHPFDSDPHRGGTVVMGLEFASGARLVHKPRSLAGDEALRTCLRLVSAGLPLDLAGCVPDSLDRGGHGWQAHVRAARAATAEDVRAYHWRFGALAALMGAIGATDLHADNVLAAGDRPVLVDLETVLHAEDRLGGQDLPDALADRMRLSVSTTLVFPQRMPTGPYSVVLGGVGVPYPQESTRTEFVLVGAGTDAVDLARRTYRTTRTQHLLAGPDGAPTNVLDHQADLQEGYAAGYREVRARRRAVHAALAARPFPLRHIVRSTGTYARLLSALTHPDRLRDQADQDRFLARVRPPTALRGPQALRFVEEAERASLAEGDVPYFTVDSDDLRLRAGGATSAPIATHPALDRAWLGLRLMDEDQLAFEQLVVDDGMSELRRLRGPSPVADVLPAPVQQLLDDGGPTWRGVRDLLRRVAVRTPGVDGDQQGWVTGLHADSLPTYDVGSAVSLHDAGGIGLFLRRAATCHPDARSTAEVARVERGQATLELRYRESLEQRPFSVLGGLASLALVRPPGDAGPAHLRALLEAPWPDAERLAVEDLAKGLPGTGLLLAGAGELGDGAAELLARVLAALPEHGVAGRAAADLAHGDLGVHWARSRIAGRLADTATRRRATAAVLAVAAQLPDGAPRGWCSGSAALALVLAETVADHGDAALVRRFAHRAAAAATDGRPVDLSVCHGSAGVVQTLVQVGRLLDDGDLLDLAATVWARELATARRDGLVTGDRAKTAVLGYFHGWAGIADTDLLLEQARAGARPWVPVGLTPADHPVGSRR